MWSRATSARSARTCIAPAKDVTGRTWRARRGRAAVASITGSSCARAAGLRSNAATSSPSQMFGRREIESLYGVTPGRLTVVYNGVDLERFHPRNREHIAGSRGRGSVPPRAFTVLFVGSARAQGACDRDRGIRGACDRASRLIVVGKGDARPYRSARLAWASASGSHGLEPEHLERWYAAADIVVLPSHYEPFGNVHLEALAADSPSSPARARVARRSSRWCQRVGREPDRPAGGHDGARAFRERGEGDVVEAARRSAEPYTYAAQVSGFARSTGAAHVQRAIFLRNQALGLTLRAWVPGPRSSWIVTGRLPRKWGTSIIPGDCESSRDPAKPCGDSTEPASLAVVVTNQAGSPAATSRKRCSPQ